MIATRFTGPSVPVTWSRGALHDVPVHHILLVAARPRVGGDGEGRVVHGVKAVDVREGGVPHRHQRQEAEATQHVHVQHRRVAASAATPEVSTSSKIGKSGILQTPIVTSPWGLWGGTYTSMGARVTPKRHITPQPSNMSWGVTKPNLDRFYHKHHKNVDYI
eukprot:9226091-Pyramimonas_sp.AAC.1